MTVTPTIFPLRHDWSEPFKVTREWQTDVEVANGRSEVRVRLRANPSISMAMRCAFDANLDTGAGRLLAQWRGATTPLLFYAPLWCDASDLTSAVTAGDATIHCDTTDRPFFEDAGYAMLWRSAEVAEVVTIDTVSASSFTLSGTAASSYAAAGTRVVPCRPMWLTMPMTVTWVSPTITTFDLTFTDQRPSAGLGLSGADTTATAASLSVYCHSMGGRTGNSTVGFIPYVVFVEAVVFDTFGIPISDASVIWTRHDNEDPSNTDPPNITVTPSIDSRLASVYVNTPSGYITATCGSASFAYGVN